MLQQPRSTFNFTNEQLGQTSTNNKRKAQHWLPQSQTKVENEPGMAKLLKRRT
jgi:hypothetical protein